MKEKFLTKEALKAFKNGNYLRSYLIYNKLAEKIGEQFFHVNLEICKKHLDLELNLEYLVKDLLSSQDDYIPASLYGDCLNKGHRFRIAVILDEFSYQCWKPEADLKRLHPDRWKQEIESFQPDFIFVESTWHGENDEWNKKILSCSAELTELITYCRKHDLPSVFWNKEDPVHFDEFLSATKLFDYVFTTDADCVPRYKHKLGHNRIYTLPFAAQPAIHNPIEKVARQKSFVFAGSWNIAYPERNADLEMILGVAQNFGSIEIYDRYSGRNLSRHQYPPKYQNLVVGSLPFSQIDQAYKRAIFAINVNSVKTSPTMFSRRVFELLASGTIVISNESQGMQNFFGNLILTGKTPEELQQKIQALWEDPEKVEKQRVCGLRTVLRQHTYQHRLQTILEKLGVRQHTEKADVCLIAHCENAQELTNVRNNFTRQMYPNIHLIICNAPHKEWHDRRVAFADSVTECKNILSARHFDYIGFFSPLHYYGAYYITDLVLAYKYTNEQIICKQAKYSVQNNTLVVSDQNFSYQKFQNCNLDMLLMPKNLFYTYYLYNLSRYHKIIDHTCLSIDVINFIEYGNQLTPNTLSQVTKRLSFTDDLIFEFKMRDQTILNDLLLKIEKIHDSNGCKFYQKCALRIALICDEFFYASIKDAANFIYLTPDNWSEKLNDKIDLLLFVSTWHGLADEWSGLAFLAKNSPKKIIAKQILDTCHQKHITTVFYSKEDPVNFWIFMDYAKQCDFIFTSDQECVSYYQEECQNKNVHTLNFCINPKEHNPIGFRSVKKEKSVVFAGSWMQKYTERCQDLSNIFDGVLATDFNLQIIDRNWPLYPKYIFPESYLPFCYSSVQHDKLQKIHKLFNWSININSIKYSSTMFANRVFELQANGCLLLSNFSVGLNNLFPNIFIVNDSTEVKYILKAFTAEELYERQITGIRTVMTNHTCYDRLAELLSKVGQNYKQPTRKVVVIAEYITDHLQQCFAWQTYPEKTLVLYNNITEKDLSSYDMVTFFDPQAMYEEFYLEDMINAFKYTNCDYITKDSWYEGNMLHNGIEHDYVTQMQSKYRTIFWRESFTPHFLLHLNDDIVNLPNGYSIDHFYYNSLIYAVQYIEQQSSQLSVIVPIYNNGHQLYGKCFASLRRSSIFAKMKVIFVDDGSTDQITKKIEYFLSRHYNNIQLFEFNDGGSGSASRPRNKGVELAQTEYLTFLDPDNEAISDGYANLFQKSLSAHYDLVFGNMYKMDKKLILFSYYNRFLNTLKTNNFINGLDTYLQKLQFLAPSIQTMVISHSLIQLNHLQQIVNAVGQDTLFSWQLLQCAKAIYLIDLPIHIYYSNNENSITNNINTTYFKKLILIQEYKIKWLIQNNYINQFMKRQYKSYTKGWIFKKLNEAQNICAIECTKLVEYILNMYSRYYQNDDETINIFLQYCHNNNYTQALQYIKNIFKNSKKPPMMLFEDIMYDKKKILKFNIEYYKIDNTVFIMKNLTHLPNCTYAWEVYGATSKFIKIFTSQYTKQNYFVYEFLANEYSSYKIRAYIKSEDGQKLSEDVFFFDFEDNNKPVVNYKTTALNKGAKS